MPSWSVVRNRSGHPDQLLYRGRLKHRAMDMFDRESPEQGSIVAVYEHADGARTLLRKSDDVVTAACSRCHRPILGDFAPAVDAFSLAPVCDACTRAERHVRVSA